MALDGPGLFRDIALIRPRLVPGYGPYWPPPVPEFMGLVVPTLRPGDGPCCPATCPGIWPSVTRALSRVMALVGPGLGADSYWCQAPTGPPP